MQISLFLLISIFAFSSGGKLINPHLDRVLQGSANYGSGPNYSSVAKKTYSSYGSGVESRYSAIGSNGKRGSKVERGSYKQCSRASHDYVFSGTIGSGKNKHYSYAIKGSSHNKGSTHSGGSGAYYSAAKGGSSPHKGSAQHGGSGAYSEAKGGSGFHGGSSPHKGSGAKGGSGAIAGSNRPYDIFAPTMRPTEYLPPIYQPPPPTHYPTSYKSIPVIPITFNQPTSEGIEIPQIPLSFQIEQGANGWAQYPDSPPLEKAFAQVASKIAGIAESSITNMNVRKTSQRKLLATTKITVTYDIITTPASNGDKTQQETYYKIANQLALSVKNNNFSIELYRLGIKLNISSIVFSDYAVFYPTLSPTSAINVLSSSGASDHSYITDSLIIGVGVLLVIGVLIFFGSLYLNKKSLQKNERDISLTEPPTHLERVSNPMTDIIPDPLRRITILHTTPSE